LPLPDALRALRHPNFRTYYAGQAISMIGTWVQSIANTWLAYKLSGSTAISGLVGFMGHIPMLVVAPFAGVMGDRFDKRRILFWVQALLIVQSVTLAVLVGFHMLTVPLLVALVFMIGLLNSVETPTRQSFFVQLIEDRADLPNAIALNSVLMNATRLIGPAMGGLLIASTSETMCYIVNAILTVAVLVSLVKIRFPEPKPDAQPREAKGFFSDLFEGWRYAFGFPVIRALLAAIGIISFTISPYVSLMPAIVVQSFKGGSDLVGYFIASVGLGAFIGALRLAARKSMVGLAKWIGIAAIVAGAATIGFALSRIVPLSMLFMAVLGFGFITAGATINTILQSIVDDDKRSRVVSLYTAAFIGSAPLGHLASGWLAELIGASNTFLVNGVICLAAGIVFATQLQRFRNALRPIYIERGIIPAPAQDPNQ
jgi:MFS family permease